jgi:hypothetical protein
VTKLVVIAVLFLAAVAAADAIRPRSEPAGSDVIRATAQKAVVHPVASSGFTAAGRTIRTRILHDGRDYLLAEEIETAFPAPLHGGLLQVAHLAAAPDGTLVVAVYAFPPGRPAVDGIEVWRDGRLESAFLVPVGTFGGGMGFAGGGRLIAGLSGDGLLVHLFTRRGRPAGTQSATSW